MPQPLRRSVLALLAVAAAASAGAVEPDLKLFADEVAETGLLSLGRTVVAGPEGPPLPLSSVTAEGYPTGEAIEAATTWDFSVIREGQATVSQSVAVDAGRTCYLPSDAGCGFTWPGNDLLAVRDLEAESGWTRSVTALELDEARGLLLTRAAVTDEGSAGEVRLCFDPSRGRPEVPVLAFPNAAAGRRFLAAGDPPWGSEVFECVDAVVQGAPCGAAGGTRASLSDGSGTEGRIRSRVVGTGTLTLPSGHVLDAVLVETVVSYLASVGCVPLLGTTFRQVQLSWFAPGLGPVATLGSAGDTTSLSFDTVSSAFAGTGLLPPLSVDVAEIGRDFVAVSWDAGPEGAANSHVVHWGTASGHDVAPAQRTGILPAGVTSATIDGLEPDTTYWLSVSAARTYVDPVSGEATAYRSLELPRSAGADLDGDGEREHVYPPEVAATTLFGPCVEGDVAPAGTGDGAADLRDFARAQQVLLGIVEPTPRDLGCGDVHPGTVPCRPLDEPRHWCRIGDGDVDADDLRVLRGLASGHLADACDACGDEPPPTGDELRRPGDIAPVAGTDGVLTIGDVVLALRFSVSLSVPDAEQRLRADVTPAVRAGGLTEVVGDGVIDIGDVVLLLRGSVGLESLSWRLREVALLLEEDVTRTAFRAVVTGWPTWARPAEAPENEECGLGGGVDARGERWALTCAHEGEARSGAGELVRIGYRAAEPLGPLSLAVAADETVLLGPDGDEVVPPPSLSLSTP